MFSGRPQSDIIVISSLTTTYSPSKTSAEVLGCRRTKFELFTSPNECARSRNVSKHPILSHFWTSKKSVYICTRKIYPSSRKNEYLSLSHRPEGSNWPPVELIKSAKSQKPMPRDLRDQKLVKFLTTACQLASARSLKIATKSRRRKKKILPDFF